MGEYDKFYQSKWIIKYLFSQLNLIDRQFHYLLSINENHLKFNRPDDAEKLFDAAFRNGKEKAAGIAKAMNKKLGAVLMVIDYTQLDEGAENNFYFKPIPDHYYYLSIKFAAE